MPRLVTVSGNVMAVSAVQLLNASYFISVTPTIDFGNSVKPQPVNADAPIEASCRLAANAVKPQPLKAESPMLYAELTLASLSAESLYMSFLGIADALFAENEVNAVKPDSAPGSNTSTESAFSLDSSWLELR